MLYVRTLLMQLQKTDFYNGFSYFRRHISDWKMSPDVCCLCVECFRAWRLVLLRAQPAALGSLAPPVWSCGVAFTWKVQDRTFLLGSSKCWFGGKAFPPPAAASSPGRSQGRWCEGVSRWSFPPQPCPGEPPGPWASVCLGPGHPRVVCHLGHGCWPQSLYKLGVSCLPKTSREFPGGSRIIADGDCSHEIKRHLLLGRKVMINLDSILESRDITLPIKVHLVKPVVFPVVMYGCESWSIRKLSTKELML